MLEQDNNEVFERKKKMFTFLPVLIFPVMILLFWGLGGGTASANDRVSTRMTNNVNTDIPDPIVDRDNSKSDAYASAQRREAAMRSALARDPYAELLQDSTNGFDLGAYSGEAKGKWEERFNDRTSNLERSLAQFSSDMDKLESSPAGSSKKRQRSRKQVSRSYASKPTSLSREEDEKVASLEAAIGELDRAGMSGQASYDDPMMFASAPAGYSAAGAGIEYEYVQTPEDSAAAEQLDRLDRIMERATMLQYPELAEEKLKAKSEANAEVLYPVSEAPSAAGEMKLFGGVRQTMPVDSIPEPLRRVRRRGGFHSNDQQADDNNKQLTVRAQIHNSVTVMDGSTVKMRLLEDVYVAGQRIPANTFVYGAVRLSGDRLSVNVGSINYRSNIYDVGLYVYDLDGQPGLAVPGSVERQIAKRETARSARQLGGGTTGSGNLAAQLASDGTRAIQEIASRKLAVIKVNLKSGHLVILRNK